MSKDYLVLLRRLNQVVEENQQLRRENTELRQQMQGLNKKQPNRGVPEFIKVMQIQKALKHAADSN